MRRLLAIGFIWCCCAGAWAILGSTLTIRSGSASDGLRGVVRNLWGPPLVQAPPSAIGTEMHAAWKKEQRYDEKAQRFVELSRREDVTTTAALALDASELRASIDLEHRRKGLLWFPTYAVSFTGRYTFRNPSPDVRRVTVSFPLEAGVTYDGFTVTSSITSKSWSRSRSQRSSRWRSSSRTPASSSAGGSRCFSSASRSWSTS
jgi:hypothetical protein